MPISTDLDVRSGSHGISLLIHGQGAVILDWKQAKALISALQRELDRRPDAQTSPHSTGTADQ